MEKLSMCRICLGKNVPMYEVVNKSLHELYEKLTDIPFVTEDKRPILACFLCCAKLKQCFRFMTKCLEAEELFAQMMSEINPLINPGHFEFCGGLTRSPVEQINIVGKCQPESIAIKVKVEVADCEGLDDVKENQPDENVENSHLDVKDIPHEHSESGSGDEPFIAVKTEVEEAIEVCKKRRAVETKGTPATRSVQPEDTTTAGLKKNEQLHLKVFKITRNRTCKPGTSVKEPYNCAQRICKKTYDCDVCQRSFIQKTLLKKHIRVHTGEKPYKCEVCLRGFSEKGNLTRHIRIHTGEKPYKCDVCQQGFIDRSSFTKHFRIHTGEKPFNCDVCQRSFSQMSELTRHLRIHTGEKPYKCDVCQKSFSLKCTLTKHVRTHTGKKPYNCLVCQRSFSQKKYLNNHMQKHIF